MSGPHSIAQAGLAVGFYGVGGLIASAVGGYLTDYLGRKNTIMLSMFSSAVAMLVLSQVSALLLLILFVCLAGLTTELYRPAISALITDLVPSEQRVLAFAWNRLAINLGYTSGPAVAGFLASRSFFLVFVGDALTSIVFGLVVLFALRVETPEHNPVPAMAKTGGTGESESFWQTVRHDRRFLIFLCAATAVSFVYFQSQSALVLQVTSLGFSSVTYGLLVSLNGLIVVFLELPLSMLARRFTALPVIIAGYVLVGVGIGLTAWALTITLLVVTVIIWTLGEIIYEPMSSVYVAQLAPERMRGRYQGTFGLSWATGLVLGPSVGSLLFAWNASFFWLLCGGIGLLAALLIWIGSEIE
jgi:MFS family permease